MTFPTRDGASLGKDEEQTLAIMLHMHLVVSPFPAMVILR